MGTAANTIEELIPQIIINVLFGGSQNFDFTVSKMHLTPTRKMQKKLCE